MGSSNGLLEKMPLGSNESDVIVSDLLSLADVPRWAVVGTTRQQSVAEHSFNVAAIARCIVLRKCDWDHDHEPDLGVVLEWALLHDASECVTGDIPAPIRNALRASLTELEKAICPWYAFARGWMDAFPLERDIVHAADLLEGARFVLQWGHGFGRSEAILGSHADCSDIAKSLVTKALKIAEAHGFDIVALQILASISKQLVGRKE